MAKLKKLAKQPKSPKPMGRPPRFATPEALQTKINEFFKDCEKGKEAKWIDKRGNYQEKTISTPPTVWGLTLFLGFCSYDALLALGKKENFAGIIMRAKLKCGQELNLRALTGQVDAKIATLNLSANHGMVLKQDNTLDAKITVELVEF